MYGNNQSVYDINMNPNHIIPKNIHKKNANVTVAVKHKCNGVGVKESIKLKLKLKLKRALYFKSPLLHHGYSAEL